MPIRRQFFDWKQPALAGAADYLWDVYRPRGSGRQLGSRSGDRGAARLAGRRRLLELLVGRAEERRAVLVPPQIVTVGQLPELLYELKKPLADDLTQQFTWVAALRQISSAQAERLVKQLPPADDLAGWLAMAKRLARVHRELAADGLDFSHVASRARRWPIFARPIAGKRWRRCNGNICRSSTRSGCGTIKLPGCLPSNIASAGPIATSC